jgi:uncharacterized delta-60 repeat protein
MARVLKKEQMGKFVLFLTAVITAFSLSVSAQQPPLHRWTARYDGDANAFDAAYALAVDNSGNVYVAGSSEGDGTDYDYVVVKYDPAGKKLWQARYNGAENSLDSVEAMAVDAAGNVYVTGESDANSQGDNYVTIKYGTDGTRKWIASYNGPANADDHAYALALDNSGNVYVTGISIGNGTYYDYATIKYGPNGNQLWVARYNGPAGSSDYAYAITVDTAGNVYVTGASNTNDGFTDYATVKYDAAGNQLWAARYDGPANGYDYAQAVAMDTAGNVYVAGYSYGAGADFDYATIKYSPAGNQLWAKRYNGPSDSADCAISLAVDNLNNIYVTGYSIGNNTGFDYATIKYDSGGNQLWISRYDGPAHGEDYASSLAVDDSGNVYVTGNSEALDGGNDFAIVKCDRASGSQLWVARYNELAADYNIAYACAVDKTGNVYVAGQSSPDAFSDSDFAAIKYTQHNYCTDTIKGDLNADLKVDYTDLIVFASHWLQTGTADGDFNNDKKVDFKDFAVLASNWLEKGAFAGDLDGNCKVDFGDYATLMMDWSADADWDDMAALTENWLNCGFALQDDCK